jgi:hypothetical protein
MRVDPDLALLDDRQLVVVHDLDRVFDRDDVRAACAVDVADHRGDRRRLSGAGGAGHQHEAARGFREAADGDRQAELLERRDLVADAADREPDQPPLPVHVDPEPADPRKRVPDVGFVRLGELAALVLRHHGVRERSGVLG